MVVTNAAIIVPTRGKNPSRGIVARDLHGLSPIRAGCPIPPTCPGHLARMPTVVTPRVVPGSLHPQRVVGEPLSGSLVHVLQLTGVAATPGTRDASHATEAAMMTPAGGTRPTPMTLAEAQVLIAKHAARTARNRAKRKARMAEARELIAKAKAK